MPEWLIWIIGIELALAAAVIVAHLWIDPDR